MWRHGSFPALGGFVFRVSFFTVAVVHSVLSVLPTAWVAQLDLRLWALWQPSALWDQRPTDLELGQILAQAYVFLPKLFQWRSRFPSYCRLLKRQTNKFSTICQCRSPATSWHCLWILASWSNPTPASQNKRHNSKREGRKKNQIITSSQAEILNKSIVAICQQQLCGLTNLVWPSGRAISPKALISYGQEWLKRY